MLYNLFAEYRIAGAAKYRNPKNRYRFYMWKKKSTTASIRIKHNLHVNDVAQKYVMCDPTQNIL